MNGKKYQESDKVSAGFILAGMVFFGLTNSFPLCVLLFMGTGLISAVIFIEGSVPYQNMKEQKAANLRLAMTAGCCLCIAAVSYHLVVSLRRMIEGGMLSFAYFIMLEVGRELFHVGMLICVILSFHRGWCKFTGSFFAGAYLFLRGVSTPWYVLVWDLPVPMERKLLFFLREGCLFLYCVGMLLFFQRRFRRTSSEEEAFGAEAAGILSLEAVGDEGGMKPVESGYKKSVQQENCGYKGNTWLTVSSVIYMVLAIIGAGFSSFIFVAHYLDAYYLDTGVGSITLYEGQFFSLFIAACSLFDNLFYLYVGLYGSCYANRPEKARTCMLLGWILLAGAVIMFAGGCIVIVRSAWLLVARIGILVILPALFRSVLAGVYLKGGKELWKKRRK